MPMRRPDPQRDPERATGRWRRASAWAGIVLPMLCALIIAAGGEPWRQALRYQRTAILESLELWRLLSAHFVHLNLSHLLLDGTSLLLVWALFATWVPPVVWWASLLAGALFIDMAFLSLHPGIGWYVGLSGVIHAQFVAGALWCALQRRPGASVMLLLLAAKLVWESVLGPMPWSESASQGPVAEEAHLYGTIGGVLGLLGCIALLPSCRGQLVR
jgi:rhomboid family GlyGly-CTERM serine protease